MARDFSYIKYVKNNAITSGFFNSDESGDRIYDADDISSLFDGLIKDGIYNTIGDMFKVSPNTGMIINIGSGRAWFNHTWIKTNSKVTIELDTSIPYLDRYDAVIIEINKNTHEYDEEKYDVGRAGHLAVITGNGSNNPQKPEMIHNETIDQYPLAYIYVHSNATEITEADIESVIGTEETPFATGLLEHIDITTLLDQYKADFNNILGEFASSFYLWFSNLQNELTENQAANLQNQINDITAWLNSISEAEQEAY